jgi:putative ABC transport system permease protein
VSEERAPRIAEALLRACAGADDKQWIVDDLEEEMRSRAALYGMPNARRWYRRQVVASAMPLVARRLEFRLRNRNNHETSLMPRVRRALDVFRTDIGYALRLWRRSPAFTACVIATLAIGVGATVAMFSVLYAVLFRPMEYAAPNEVAIAIGARYEDFDRLRSAPPVKALVGWRSWRAGLREPDGSVGVRLSAAVAPSFFDVLGVRAARGRMIGGVDDAASDWNGVVMSWAAWEQDFGRRPDIVGTKLTIDDATYTVVGVAPRYFTDPLGFPVNDIETAFFRLLRPDERRGPLQAVVRLRAPTTPELAQRDLDPLVERPPGAASAPTSIRANAPRLRVVSAYDARIGDVKKTLYVLSGAVALLLLIACANAANLLLTRSVARRGELAVRTALGAERSRLIAQLLTECLALAAVASGIGAWLGYLGTRAIVGFAGDAIPRAAEVTMHPAVLFFIAGIAVLSAVLIGAIPAVRDSAGHASVGASGFARGSVGSRSSKRIRGVLAVAEVTLAVVLGSGGGILVRSLWRLEHVNPGFDTKQVLTVRVTLPPNRVAPPMRLQRNREILAALQSQPGVEAAAVVTVHPLTGGGNSVPVVRPGAEVGNDRSAISLVRPILGDYFKTMGIRVVAGRAFTNSDDANSEPVVVLSRKQAARLYPGGAMDHLLAIGDKTFRVVGLVDDIKEFALDQEDHGTVYLSYDQAPAQMIGGTSTFLVRAPSNGHTLDAAVRAAVRSVDAELPIAFFRTMRDMMDVQLLTPRLRTVLLGTFGVLAAILAIVGLASVMAYTVSQSLPEIGVRLALGATGRQVAGFVLRESVLLAGIGTIIGVIGAVAAGRLLQSLVFDVASNDPTVIALVAVGTVLFALAASWLPARRAAGVDPVRVLRQGA